MHSDTPEGAAETGRVVGAALAAAGTPMGIRSTQVNRTRGRVVQVFKVLLPTMAIVLVGLLILWPQLVDKIADVGLDLKGIDADSVDSVQVANATYRGVDSEDQPFTITSNVRRETIDSTQVFLEEPKADIMLSDESWAAITAAEGVFDQSGQMLRLAGDVSLFHDLGYEFRTEEALVNIQAGEAQGDAFVQGQGPFGRIEAEGFRIFDRGARILLTGKAKLVINP